MHWRVVGFQRRMGVEPGDDEALDWSEYLLCNQSAAFAFLVDDSERAAEHGAAPPPARPGSRQRTHRHVHGRQYELTNCSLRGQETTCVLPAGSATGR